MRRTSYTQLTINSNNLFYAHDGSDTTEDSFTFTVEDPEGGWLVTQRFNIIIDENAVVSISEVLNENDLLLSPNPAKDELYVKLLQAVDGPVQVLMHTIQGQELSRNTYANLDAPTRLNVANLPSGIYLVSVQTEDGMLTKKVSISK